MKYPPINLLNKHLLIGGFMKKVFGDNDEKTYQMHDRSPYLERLKAMKEENLHVCFGAHDDTSPVCRTCIYKDRCKTATLTKSMSDHQKAMEAAKPVDTEKSSLTLFVTEIEICDEIGNRDAKISLSDGDCVQVNIDTYHTLSSWRELSALVEQGMIQMGITT